MPRSFVWVSTIFSPLPVKGFVYFFEMFVGYVGIDLRRRDVSVTEKRLHAS